MTSKPERINHDFGDLQIATVKPQNEDQWQIVAAHLFGAVGLMDLRYGTVKSLNTSERFASDEDAMAFASRQIGLPLRPTDKYRLRKIGFRDQCELVPAC